MSYFLEKDNCSLRIANVFAVMFVFESTVFFLFFVFSRITINGLLYLSFLFMQAEHFLTEA